MNAASMQPWRRVADGELRRWAGPRLFALGCAIQKAGRVRDLVSTLAGETFATVVGTAGRDHFGGVAMEGDDKHRHFWSLCSCGRAPCEHAVAVAIGVRNAVAAKRTPPRVARLDGRAASLPRPEPGVDFLPTADDDDGAWLDEEGRCAGGG